MMSNNKDERIVGLIEDAESDKLKEEDDNALVELAAKILMALPNDSRLSILSKYMGC